LPSGYACYGSQSSCCSPASSAYWRPRSRMRRKPYPSNDKRVCRTVYNGYGCVYRDEWVLWWAYVFSSTPVADLPLSRCRRGARWCRSP